MSNPVYNVSVDGNSNDTDLMIQSAGASISDNGNSHVLEGRVNTLENKTEHEIKTINPVLNKNNLELWQLGQDLEPPVLPSDEQLEAGYLNNSNLKGQDAGGYWSKWANNNLNFGKCVALSSDGTIAMVSNSPVTGGSHEFQDSSLNNVVTYKLTDNKWVQNGIINKANVTIPELYEGYEYFLSQNACMSGDGKTIAIPIIYSASPGQSDASGRLHILIFKYTNNEWNYFDAYQEPEEYYPYDSQAWMLNINEDGSVIAQGADYNQYFAEFTGLVEIIQLDPNSNKYVRNHVFLGSDIESIPENEKTIIGIAEVGGPTTHISPDGNIVLFAAGYDNTLVFSRNNSENKWLQVGNTINSTDEGFPYAVRNGSINSTGNKLVVANNISQANYAVAGNAELNTIAYELKNNVWVKMGNTITNVVPNKFSGIAKSEWSFCHITHNDQLGKDIVYVNCVTSGEFKMYELVNDEWVQLGHTIYRENGERNDTFTFLNNGPFDFKVTPDGNHVIVGYPGNLNEDGQRVGSARVFKLTDKSRLKINTDVVTQDIFSNNLNVNNNIYVDNNLTVTSAIVVGKDRLNVEKTLVVLEGLVTKNIADISSNSEYFNNLNNIAPEMQNVLGNNVMSDGITPEIFSNYNKLLGIEAQHNKQQIELTASKNQVDMLENKLKEFKAVDFNLPPNKGTSSLVVPETKRGFSPLRNDAHHTVNGLVSVFNTGIIPDTWTITPELEENDSGVMINKNNIFNATDETLDKYSLNHLMTGVELNDYKLSFSVSIKDLTKSSAFLMFDILGEGSSFVYNFYDFDSHYNNALLALKTHSDNLNLATSSGSGSEYFEINKEYNVTVYKQGSEIAILFDASGTTTRKVFSVNEVGNFGFLSNSNIEISSIKLNAVLAVLDDGYDTPDRLSNPSGFAYNVLSSTDGNKILYQHKMSLYDGTEKHVFEIVEFKPGYIESLFRTQANGNTFIFTTDNNRFIATEIDHNNERKMVIFDTESERSDKLLTDVVTFDNLIREKLSILVDDVSMQLYIVGLYSLTTLDANKELYMKVILEKSIDEDPNKLFGELPNINKKLTHTGTIKIHKQGDNWVVDDPILYSIRTPTNIFAFNDGIKPSCSPREPSNSLSYNDKENSLHFNVCSGYELITMGDVKRKESLSLVFYKGVLVSKTIIRPYTFDSQSTTNTAGNTGLLLDRTKYMDYINCVCVNTNNLMILTGVYLNKPVQSYELRNKWGVFSMVNTSSVITLYNSVNNDITLTEWDVISSDIYSVVDDRFGLVEFEAADPTKIPNLDTYDYGQTINDEANVVVIPCRNASYKSLAIYKINLPIPPNYAIGFYGAPGNLELKCIVESNKLGRYHAGMFNRATVSKNYIASTNWYTGTTDFISINSLLNTNDSIIKALPKNTSEFANDYRGVRTPTIQVAGTE